MYTQANPTACCGLVEIESLADAASPKQALLAISDEVVEKDYAQTPARPYGLGCAFVLFTDNGGKYAQTLATYLRRHKMGKVFKTERKLNPNTGKKIRAWIWQIAPRTTLAWYKKHQETDE